MANELQIAKTILQQLGGGRFIAMTGARPWPQQHVEELRI